MKWYLEVLKKYAVFAGRARREEYWMFQLINILIIIVLYAIDTKIRTTGPGVHLGLLSLLYSLAVALPALGVLVRRLHDTGRSGWWFFISLIPLLGPLTLLVFTVLDSQPGENQYQS